MENYSQKSKTHQAAYNRAKKRLDKRIGFYWHLFFYLLINVFIIVSIESQYWDLGLLITPFFWGIGLFFHALYAYEKNIIFGEQWKARKIKAILDKQRKNEHQ